MSKIAQIATSPRQSVEYLFYGYTQGATPMNYWRSEVPGWYRKLQPMPSDSAQLKALSVTERSYWYDEGYEAHWSDINSVVWRIGATIRYAPAVIDYAFFVDEGATTERRANLCRSTEWVELPRRGYARFSEARTAKHIFGALRSPIDGKGFALEVTDRPDSTDARDFVTVLVFQPEQEEDKNHSWVEPHDARVFDLREYVSEPFSVGPLYGGFPNEVTDPEMLSLIMTVVRELVTQILQS